MKSIKIYLIVVSALLVAALSAGVYVWFIFQSTQSQIKSEGDQVKILDNDVNNNTSSVIEKKSIIIEVDTLSEIQQKTLNIFGFDNKTIVITEAMIRCAENAVSEERFSAIVSGDLPSSLESLELLPCFKK